MPGKADHLRDALIATLQEIKRQQEQGEVLAAQAHRDADNALLAYIDDVHVITLFAQIKLWSA